jgi:hypothetical protein
LGIGTPLWLDARVRVPRYRPVGWALIVAPVILVAVMSGTELIATTGIAAGLLLLGTAVAGFHDLAGVRRLDEQAKASDFIVAARARAPLSAALDTLCSEPPLSAAGARRRAVVAASSSASRPYAGAACA